MPESNILNYDDLTSLQQGCIDCIIDCESNGDHAADWRGVGREAFAPETLRIIAADCELFLASAAGPDSDFEKRLFEEVDAYDLGWHLHLERQGTGVGFADLLIEEPLLGRLQNGANKLRPLEVDVVDGSVRRSGARPHSSSPTR